MKPLTTSAASPATTAVAASVTFCSEQCEAAPPEAGPRILVGIDWADGEHAYAMLDPQGKLQRGTVAQTPEAIAQLLGDWQRSYPDTPVDVCLETSRGPLINALLEYPQVHRSIRRLWRTIAKSSRMAAARTIRPMPI